MNTRYKTAPRFRVIRATVLTVMQKNRNTRYKAKCLLGSADSLLFVIALRQPRSVQTWRVLDRYSHAWQRPVSNNVYDPASTVQSYRPHPPI